MMNINIKHNWKILNEQFCQIPSDLNIENRSIKGATFSVNGVVEINRDQEKLD